MKYLTSKQLNAAEQKVKDILIAYWHPEDFDLVEYKGYVEAVEWYSDGLGRADNGEIIPDYKSNVIPLFTAEQLIDFIQAKKHMQITYRTDGPVVVNTLDQKNVFCRYEGDNLINALWACVQGVILNA